ncbi:MAG: hypothetical protein GY772_21030 [bacterium]|nr:hypothetical protein [bacterium]
MPVIDGNAADPLHEEPALSRSASGHGSCSSSVERDLEELLTATVENPADTVTSLKVRATALKNEKKALQKRLRNAQRRVKRIKEKARVLSDADLLGVIRMRQARRCASTEDASSTTAERAKELEVTSSGNSSSADPPAPEQKE